MRKQFSESTILRNQDFIAQVQKELKIPADGIAGPALFSLMGSILGIKLEYRTDVQLKTVNESR